MPRLQFDIGRNSPCTKKAALERGDLCKKKSQNM